MSKALNVKLDGLDDLEFASPFIAVSDNYIAALKQPDPLTWPYAWQMEIFEKSSNGSWSKVKILTATTFWHNSDYYSQSGVQYATLFGGTGTRNGTVGRKVMEINDNFLVLANYTHSPAGNHTPSKYIGKVEIYEKNYGGDNNWGLRKTLNGDEAELFNYGTAISLDGDILAISSRYNQYSTEGYKYGSIHIYSKNHGGDNNWGKVTTIKNSDATLEDGFGKQAIILKGDYLVATAANWDDGINGDVGKLYIYKKDSQGTWNELNLNDDGTPGIVLGTKVIDNSDPGLCMDGDYIAIRIKESGELPKACIYYKNEGGDDKWGKVYTISSSEVSDSGQNGVITTTSTTTWNFNDQYYMFEHMRLMGNNLFVSFIYHHNSIQYNPSRTRIEAYRGGGMESTTYSDSMFIGCVYVFTKDSDANTWSQTDVIYPPLGTVANRKGQFGHCMECTSTHLFIQRWRGENNPDSNAKVGTSYPPDIYQLVDSPLMGVTEENTTTLTNRLISSDRSNIKMSDDGNYLFVGSYHTQQNNQGRIDIYKKNHNNLDWELIQAIDSPHKNANFGEFGINIDTDGDYLFVGAKNYKPDYATDSDQENFSNSVSKGGVLIYKKDHGGTDNWGLIKTIDGDNSSYSNRIGKVVANNGRLLIFRNIVSAGSNAACWEHQVNEGGDGNWGRVRTNFTILNYHHASSDNILDSSYYQGSVLDDDNNTVNWGSGQAVYTMSYQGSSPISEILSGDYLFIGFNRYIVYPNAWPEYSSMGGIYIKKNDYNNGNNWPVIKEIHLQDILQKGNLGELRKKDERMHQLRLGYSLAYSNGVLVAGSHLGYIFIFEKDEGGTDNWGLVSIVNAYNPHWGKGSGSQSKTNKEIWDQFGYDSIAVNNNTIIVSAKNYTRANDKKGNVYIIQKDSVTGKWFCVNDIYKDNTTQFGGSIILRDDILYVAAEDKLIKYTIKDLNPAIIAAKRASDAESSLQNSFNLLEAIITAMKALRTQTVNNRKRVTISNDIKNSIIKTSGGVKDTKKNIRKKRREFLKILVSNNFDDDKIEVKAADIGLDETLNLGENRQVKENVLVVKKNQTTPISVSSDVSADTAVYADLEELNDSIKIDVGLSEPVVITNTRIEEDAIEALTDGQVEANATNEITVVDYGYGNNKYNINGTATPTLYLIKGKTYRFNQTDNSNGVNGGHPMKLYLEADKTTEYTTGVTTGGAPGTDGYLEITVANDAPSTLHYQCSAHPNMGGEFKVVSPGTDRVSPQWTVSLGSVNVVKEEGENVTVNGVTIYIGSMYVDGSNLGINPTGLTDLASTGIPFIQGTTTVAPLDDIRSRRSLVLDNIFYGDNLGATSLTATAAHLGLDKTVGDNVRTNVKVFKANSEIDLTSDLDSDEGGYVDLSNVGHYALIKGISDEKIRIQVTQVNPTKKYMVKNVDGTVDILPDEFENGDKFTIYNKTFYLGGVYTSNLNEGLVVGEMNDLSTLKIRFANVGTNGVQSNITTIDSLSNIRANRHTAIGNLWKENSSITNFKTKTQDLALDITVGKPMKNNVVVYKANSAVVDLSPTSSIIDKNTGVYADLNEVDDYMDFNTGADGAFRIKVVQTNPKKYAIRNTADTLDLFNVRFLDGQWFTFRGVTFYFGGVMTNGTNDGITAADPYVFPINGNPYKLPDENANYCLYADENTFITGVVSQLSDEKQEEMRQWVVDRLGSDTNNGAKLVTDGFFYSNVHVNTTVGELVLDMETKVCNTNNKDVFNVTFKNTRDNTELFKGEHKTTATISWNDNGNSMAVDVDFFENPQIRNGIRMNTVMTKSEPIGLLVEDYEPSLLCVENSKNKLSMYDTLLNVLEEGQRVEGEKLNLQKEGELWTRHKM